MTEWLSQYSTAQQIAMLVCIVLAVIVLLVDRYLQAQLRSDEQQSANKTDDWPDDFDIDPAAFWRKDD